MTANRAAWKVTAMARRSILGSLGAQKSGGQSRSFQRQVIAEAQRGGTLADLYWFVEMFLPVQLGGGYAAAAYRGGVPVIAVAPDPAASEAEADLLRWMFEDSNRGRGITFSISLTARDILESGYNWYLYGHERTSIDNICPDCGQVHATEHYEPWACCGWSQMVAHRKGREDAGE